MLMARRSEASTTRVRAKFKRQVSSGGVIFREVDGRIEIALIGLKSGSVWCLPKGAVERGEDPEATALREVKEETGLLGRPLEKLGAIEYWFSDKEEGARVHKTVHFYLFEYVEGKPEDHDREVEEVRWYPADEALKLMTYRNEREVVEKALQTIEERTSKPATSVRLSAHAEGSVEAAEGEL